MSVLTTAIYSAREQEYERGVSRIKKMFQYRGDRKHLVKHPYAGYGDGKTYGAAIIPGPHNMTLKVIFSEGAGWEHVSISCQNRMPNWPEMCFTKDLFWDSEDCVVQYHPPGSKYTNYHPLVLHLWKPVGQQLPLPDAILVGPIYENKQGI